MAAPVALFAFNRPDHTRRSLQQLARAEDFDQHHLAIFCDGPKGDMTPEIEATRSVVTEFAKTTGADVTVRERNLGLSASIRDGVTSLCDEHGAVIVLEDDLLVAPAFLNFMQQGLVAHEHESRVMQVAGYSPITPTQQRHDAFALPITTTWGWATWNRAWVACDWNAASEASVRLKADRALEERFNFGGSYPYSRLMQDQAEGALDSWGILWWWHVFCQGGLVVYPSESLVTNAGMDGSGRHSRNRGRFAQTSAPTIDRKVWDFPPIDGVDDVDQQLVAQMERALSRGALRKRNFRELVATASSWLK